MVYKSRVLIVGFVLTMRNHISISFSGLSSANAFYKMS